VPKLAQRFRVIVPDLPGSGESEKPATFRYDREGFADVLCDLMAGLDVSRAHIVGHSFGGAVALALASDHPERVLRLALINSLSYPFQPPLSVRLALAPLIGSLLFKQLYTRPVFHAYCRNNLFAPGFAYDRATVDAYYDAFKTPDAREAAFQTLPATRDMTSLGPKISKVRAPTLVLWGESDAMLPIQLAMRLAREIQHARLETLPDIGHSPAEENPTRTAELLLRHFEPGSETR
jgi:pimeloyl-ACP methyl ester carboxylesterase